MFSLGATLFACANHTLGDDEEPAFSHEFDELLARMTDDSYESRASLADVAEVSASHVTSLIALG